MHGSTTLIFTKRDEWLLGCVVVANCGCVFLGFVSSGTEYIAVFRPCHDALVRFYLMLAVKHRKNTSFSMYSLQSG